MSRLDRTLDALEPWLHNMGSPFMRYFITGALMLAAGMFVAMLVIATS